MFLNPLSKKELFSVFILLFSGLLWLALILSFLGIFYGLIIFFYVFLAIVFFIYLAWKNFRQIKIKKNEIFFFVSAVFLVFLYAYFSQPTIFSGRDQGSLSEASIRLSQNHKLDFYSPAEKEFFQIYGQGQALNFPGFSYKENGNLITHFPLGYIVWLASFFSLFGLFGLTVANGVSFFLFSCSFYFLAKKYLSPFYAWLSWFLLATSFTSFWFFKFTLSENLALTLVWIGLYFFISFWHHPKKIYLVSFLSIFGFLVFTRIEGLAFLATASALLFWKFKKQPEIRALLDKKILFFIFGLIFLYILNIFIDKYFFLSIAKAVLKPFLDSTASASFSTGIFPIWTVLSIFYLYGLLTFFLLGLAGIFFSWRQRKIELLLPFLILCPAFIYVIFPNISGDHPWMLRRFAFAVIPVSVFYSILFLQKFLSKKLISRFFLALLLIGNSVVFYFFILFIPNQNLLSQIKPISETFKKTDLVLVDQKATGENWAMMSGPISFLFDLQVVYFFNPNDLEKIDLSKFSDVYFIIPNDNLDFYSKNNLLDRLSIEKNYFLENKTMKNFSYNEKLALPEIETHLILGKIYRLKQ